MQVQVTYLAEEVEGKASREELAEVEGRIMSKIEARLKPSQARLPQVSCPRWPWPFFPSSTAGLTGIHSGCPSARDRRLSAHTVSCA